MYYFIINPHSKTGKARLLWKQIREELELRHIKYKEFFTERAGHATLIAKEICSIDNNIKNIIIVGGDGTANEVINGIDSYQNVILGYLPTGSSNDLARGLGLPTNPMQALEHILNPKQFHYIDHGIIEYLDTNTKHKFAVSSGIGYDANVCYEVHRSKAKKFLNKIGLGKLIYLLIAFKQIISNVPVNAEIIIDNSKQFSVKNMIFAVSMIHKYEGGGLLMAPSAKSNDRKLTVCMASNIPKLKVFFLMPTLIFGKHINVKGIQLFDCSTIEIIPANKMGVHTDGEFRDFHAHVKLSCTDEQIRMII